MTDLNLASADDLAQAGVAPAVAAQVLLWRPYRSWENLLTVPGCEDEVAERLQAAGFEIIAPDETAWSKPAPFRVSSQRSAA